MAKITEQLGTMNELRNLIDTYGIKRKWLAEQTKIHPKMIDAFISERSVLGEESYARLLHFIERYKKTMENFKVENL